MKISSQKLSVEAFPEQANWISKLLTPLNSFISQVFSALQNNITVGDNLYQEIKTITFVNDAAAFPQSFSTKFLKYPEMVLVGSCISSLGLYPSAQPLITWSYADGVLKILSVSGLTANLKYSLKLLIIYA
jgi:hypothetical protein